MHNKSPVAERVNYVIYYARNIVYVYTLSVNSARLRHSCKFVSFFARAKSVWQQPDYAPVIYLNPTCEDGDIISKQTQHEFHIRTD